jgi:hypothetical protein
MVNELNGHSDMLRIAIIVYMHLFTATANDDQVFNYSALVVLVCLQHVFGCRMRGGKILERIQATGRHAR